MNDRRGWLGALTFVPLLLMVLWLDKEHKRMWR